MFPYAMLATMPIFSHVDWPKKLPAVFSYILTKDVPQGSSHCVSPGSTAPGEKTVTETNLTFSETFVQNYFVTVCDDSK